MKQVTAVISLLLLICIFGIGCEKMQDSFLSSDNQYADTDAQFRSILSSNWVQVPQYPPTELVDLDYFGQAMNFWPYTGVDFSATPQDPINLVFVGHADPRDIRAALLSLDGDRSAFGLPNEAPFNAQWDDAIGDMQSGYGEESGWTGSAIQLACGEYGPLRFHMRLFRIGDYTVANAHLDLQIPGTADHQVISWEAAEQFVMVDLIRTGLLGAEPQPSGMINPPNFKTIPSVIYNMLPVELKGLIGGPLGDVTEDVPIGSDGQATVFYLAGSVPYVTEIREQNFIITYDQTIPKPFCESSEYDYLYVNGDVTLYQTTEMNEDGTFRMKFQADGVISATPVNPLTGEIIGETMEVVVKENHRSYINDTDFSASSLLFQKLLPTADPNSGWFFKRLRVDSKANNGYEEKVSCGSDLNVQY